VNPYADGTRIHVQWSNGDEATGALRIMDNAVWVQVAGMTLLIDDDCEVTPTPPGPVFDVPIVRSVESQW
jgi:hypothetical protein